MATSAPPILPISTPQSKPPTILTTTTTSDTTTTTTTSAFRTFISRLHDQIKDALSQARPWPELIDRTAISKPDSLSDATTRLRKNYSYFRVNYLAFISSVVALSLITHPFSLLTLAFLLATWSFFYLFKPADRPVVLFNRTFSDRETLGCLTLLSIFVVFLTNVASVLMYAVFVGVAAVCAHGVFRVPEDLFLDDQDSSLAGETTGFLSFLGTASRGAAVASAPARV